MIPQTSSASTQNGPKGDWIVEIGRIHTNKLIVRLFRYRIFMVPILSVFIVIFALWDPDLWKLVWVAGTLGLLTLLSALEYWRVSRQQASTSTMLVNLAIMILLQCSMIYITGGIESPLLPIFLPMCLAAGMVAPNIRQALAVAVLPASLSIILAAGCLHELFPRAAPAFFELGAGWVHMPVYTWTTAVLMVSLSLVTAVVANSIRNAIGAQVMRVVDARQQAVDSLASRNRELLSVSRTIAHELKNPLASIQGLAQLLARGIEPDSKQAERMQVMRREIARMGEVLDGFRNFTRPMARLNPDRVDLAALVADVVALHEGIASQGGLELELMRTPVTLRCDAHKVKQVLINLLQNALEATPPGGRVMVRLGSWQDGGARIELQDSGPGLDQETSAHLFEPGFTTKAGGSGIGLVVARTIVEQHGGKLEMGNAASGGGLACLCLPAEPNPEVLPDLSLRDGVEVLP